MKFQKGLRIMVVALALTPAAGPAQNSPPRETGPFREPDLVELVTLDPTLKLDIRYATPDNFAGRVMYTQARAFLQRPAAEALVRAGQRLRAQGYGLIIFDGYRPWSVTKHFWDVTPESKKKFVANPKTGSRHNRGAAIDLTLCFLQTGQPVEMPTGYDEFTSRAAIDYAGASDTARFHRDLLRRAMEAEGFTPHRAEWWHYDHNSWRHYPILDIPFSQIPREGTADAAAAKASGPAVPAQALSRIPTEASSHRHPEP